MELACQATQGTSPNTKNFVHNPWYEEASSTSLEGLISPAITIFHSSEVTCKVLGKISVSNFDSSEDITTSPGRKACSSYESSTTIQRSITDLPAALVSEILHCLDAKELGVVSCVSTALNRIASDHHGWKEFYCERWGMPLGNLFPTEKSWKELFIEREFRTKIFMGRYSVDALYGHTEAVRFLNHSSEFRLWEHEGPVTCLALDSLKIYSGSWDMSVRIWDRIQLKCVKILRHGDWVWSLVPCGSTIATSAGRDAYIWGAESGKQVSVIQNVHVGNAYSLARSLSGDLLFTGGEDGAIHMYKVPKDDTDENITCIATWVPHNGPILSLAFEFPWLVSSSSDGKVALINVRKLLRSSCQSSSRSRVRVISKLPPAVEPPQRMLHGFGPNLFSVDIGADRIVCGGEEEVLQKCHFKANSSSSIIRRFPHPPFTLDSLSGTLRSINVALRSYSSSEPKPISCSHSRCKRNNTELFGIKTVKYRNKG
ncbi:hypothetical protein H6P81_002979 [Aristolochia fimbriata]|uniref:F-box domain-containing protein n=1 Tax=Aristolochia fimbriata TaxID=158543 RepID=A0AAV7FEH1_ARIFI|nr:hypothetical protein H6P81_002979 [Aristolochia fimbriata]